MTSTTPLTTGTTPLTTGTTPLSYYIWKIECHIAMNKHWIMTAMSIATRDQRLPDYVAADLNSIQQDLYRLEAEIMNILTPPAAHVAAQYSDWSGVNYRPRLQNMLKEIERGKHELMRLAGANS